MVRVRVVDGEIIREEEASTTPAASQATTLRPAPTPAPGEDRCILGSSLEQQTRVMSEAGTGGGAGGAGAPFLPFNWAAPPVQTVPEPGALLGLPAVEVDISSIYHTSLCRLKDLNVALMGNRPTRLKTSYVFCKLIILRCCKTVPSTNISVATTGVRRAATLSRAAGHRRRHPLHGRARPAGRPRALAGLRLQLVTCGSPSQNHLIGHLFMQSM